MSNTANQNRRVRTLVFVSDMRDVHNIQELASGKILYSVHDKIEGTTTIYDEDSDMIEDAKKALDTNPKTNHYK